jgi:hypothetical protein
MSRRRQPVHRLRLLVILCAVVIMGPGLITPPTVQACPPQQIEYTYYTDATYTVSCGSKIITCSCGVYPSGCVTNYYTIDWYDC